MGVQFRLIEGGRGEKSRKTGRCPPPYRGLTRAFGLNFMKLSNRPLSRLGYVKLNIGGVKPFSGLAYGTEKTDNPLVVTKAQRYGQAVWRSPIDAVFYHRAFRAELGKIEPAADCQRDGSKNHGAPHVVAEPAELGFERERLCTRRPSAPKTWRRPHGATPLTNQTDDRGEVRKAAWSL